MKRLFAFLTVPVIALALSWPVGDPDEPRPIGNSWGQFQQYGSSYPYLHPGVDIMSIGDGEPVFAVGDGIVKAWMTTLSDYHWRLAIADYKTLDSCDGWLYAHIDPDRYHLEEGDRVSEGDLIGFVVPWQPPHTDFDHLHFARIRGAGETWSSDWLFIDNPTVDLDPSGDTIAPIFENAVGPFLLGFQRNHAPAWEPYQHPDSIYGDVDVIARIHDKTGTKWPSPHDTVWERLMPMVAWIEYHGLGINKGPYRSFLLDGDLQWAWHPGISNPKVIYRQDSTCFSLGNYTERDFYCVLTNTDGDSLREEKDYEYCWRTTDFPNGYYWVVVTVQDAAGNTAVDSMRVRIQNFPGPIPPTSVSDNNDPSQGFKIITPVITRGTALTVISRYDEELCIYDMNGQLRLNTSLQSSPSPQRLSIGQLPVGVYVVSTSKLGSFKFTITP